MSTDQDDIQEVNVSLTSDASLEPTAQSFQQGWLEAQRGETYPVSTLWDDIDKAHDETMADFFVGYAGTVNSREIFPEGAHLSQDTGRKWRC